LLTLLSTDKVILDCSKQVDSRPPVVKFYWRRNVTTIRGSGTYLMKYEGYMSDQRPEQIGCAPYDAFGK